MSKQKKTRQEKIIADLRRKLSENTSSTSYSLPASTYSVPHHVAKELPFSYNIGYLAKDLQKTILVTAGIILAELLLFYLLKNQLLTIPTLGY